MRISDWSSDVCSSDLWDDRYSDQDFWEAAAAAAIAKGIEIPTGLFPTPVYGVHYPVTKVGPTWKVLHKSTPTSFDVTKYPLGPALPDFDSSYRAADFLTNAQSAECRVGKAWVSPCSSRWSPYH